MNTLKDFINAKSVEGRSEKTTERYQYILEKFLADTGVSPEAVTASHIRGFLMDEKSRGISDTSLEGTRSIISSFYTWMLKEGIISSNPCSNIGTIKCKKKIFPPFSDSDIKKLKNSCITSRDQALVCFLASTGARISEVCALNRSDIDFKEGECKVLGKGNKERIVYFDESTATALHNYFKERKDNSPALFAGHGTDRIEPHGVRFMLNALGKRAGVEHVHPHRFRRTLATSLNEDGMQIQDIAFLLGHENITTTTRYITTKQENVKAAYKKLRK